MRRGAAERIDADLDVRGPNRLEIDDVDQVST